MHELAEAAGAGLFIAEYVARAIAAIGLWQLVVMFRDKAGERSRQVIAQRQPLLVIILKREDAFIRAVEIGQEFAERFRIFNEGCFHCFKAVELIDLANGRCHAMCGGNLARATVSKAARQTGFDGRFRGLVGH